MKRILSAVAAFAATVGLMGGIVSAVPVTSTPPAQCTSTYTNQVNANVSSGSVKGTAANDLIIVNGDFNSVKGGAGDDCIVVNAGSDYNSVDGEAGNDVIVSHGTQNTLKGSNDNDGIYSDTGNAEALVGGAGTDTCVYDFSTSAAKQCEL